MVRIKSGHLRSFDFFMYPHISILSIRLNLSFSPSKANYFRIFSYLLFFISRTPLITTLLHVSLQMLPPCSSLMEAPRRSISWFGWRITYSLKVSPEMQYFTCLLTFFSLNSPHRIKKKLLQGSPSSYRTLFSGTILILLIWNSGI